MHKTVNLHWYKKDYNFGDMLNPYLIPKLFNIKVNWITPGSNTPHIFSIGSILQKANNSTAVWGSGFISNNSRISNPSKIFAVRGPLTYARLINAGIPTPKIFGDPALLLPNVYSPQFNKKWKIGIIPHYVDKKSNVINMCSKIKGVKIIDVQEKSIESIINDILACEIILSSSLHGLIVADAYDIPNIWIKISNKLIGGNFKFNDYFKSVSRNIREPIIFTTKSNIFDIVKNYSLEKIIFNSQPLLKSNPFI